MKSCSNSWPASKFIATAQLTARYPHGIPNRIVVTLDDGQQLTAENEFPPGHDQNPLSDNDVTLKFQRMAQGVLDEKTQQKVLDTCWKLEDLKNVSTLLGLFPAVDA